MLCETTQEMESGTDKGRFIPAEGLVGIGWTVWRIGNRFRVAGLGLSKPSLLHMVPAQTD